MSSRGILNLFRVWWWEVIEPLSSSHIKGQLAAGKNNKRSNERGRREKSGVTKAANRVFKIHSEKPPLSNSCKSQGALDC